MRVGIIGGGMAGLSAAYELSKAGHRVTLFEREPELGGQVATFKVAGERVERFYHHIFRSDVDIIELLGELGLGGKLMWLDSRMGFLHHGRVYDFVTAADLLRFTPLGLVDRVRLGLVSLRLRWYHNWPALEGITAEEWLLRYGGRHSYEIVWEPLLRNKFGESSHEVGMVWLWSKIHLRFASRARGREQLGYLRGSFGILTDALARRVLDAGGEIHTCAPVSAILTEGGRAVGLTAAGKDYTFDAIIATIGSPMLLQLVPGFPEEYVSKLEAARYQKAVCLVLVLARPLSRIYWLNISDASIPFVAIIEHTNLIDPTCYGDRSVVYISNYLSADSPLARLDSKGLLTRYLPHLKQVNPRFDPSWVEEYHLFSEEAGQPVVTTSYSSRVPGHRTPLHCLWLANTTQIYPEDRGMNYSIRLGRRVSRMVATEGSIP